MRTRSEARAAAAESRHGDDAAEGVLAGALGALPGLPPAARAAQRAALEALASELLPSAPPGAAGLPRWLLLLAAAALLLVAARFRADGGARPSPSPSVGEATSSLGAGRPTAGKPDLVASPPAAAPPSPAATLAGSAGASRAAAGPALGTVVDMVVGTTGREPGTPAATRPGVARVSGPASTIALARPGRTAEAPQAIAPAPASRAPSAAPCRQEALPPLPAGAGPWIVGRIQDDRCRPLAEVLLVFGTVAGGTEFLARTERDGSYAVALDPGTYRAELLVDGPWWSADGLLDEAGMLTRGAVDVPLRVDFVVGGGER